MKKTLNITIGGRVFAIEDDAYERLNAYLADVRTVFLRYPDADEIVADMEDRMADQFESQGNTTERCITLANIEALIATMGSAEDLRRTVAGEEPLRDAPRDDASYTKEAPRKLYRNPDDKIILGVCSGIAAYFNIDTVFVRLAFVGFTLLGGSGIILYLILALIMPEAKTTTEKMAMRGEPITLAGVVEQMKAEFTDEKNEARIANAKRVLNETSQKIFHENPRSLGRNVMRVIERIVNFAAEVVQRFFRVIIPVIVRVAGAFALLFGIGFFCAPIVFGTFVLTNNAMILGAWGAVIPGGIVLLMTLLAMAAAIIPATLFILLGISMLRYKNSFPGRLTGALIVMWIIIMITGASIIVSHMPRWNDAYDTYNQPVSVTVPVPGPFNRVLVDDEFYHQVRIVGGTTTSIRMSGNKISIDQTALHVQEGELRIENVTARHWEMFNKRSRPEIIITVPSIESITVGRNNAVEINKLRQAKLSIKAYGGNIRMNDNDIGSYQIEQRGYSEIRIESGTTTVQAVLANGWPHLITLGATLVNPDIKITDAARVHLGIVSGTLSVNANGDSELYYAGTPIVESNVSKGSKVEPYPASIWNDEERERYSGQSDYEE